MQQVLVRKGRVSVENVPAPLVEDGHVLVEVAYSLISTGTEASIVENSGQLPLGRAIEQPEKLRRLAVNLRKQRISKIVGQVKRELRGLSQPLGYSCSGIVIQIGRGITDIQPGDRVACAGAGVANHAEIVLVPRNLLVKVPDHCDLKSAASVTLGSIAMQGVRRAAPELGEVVGVIGLGLLGQIAVQLLKAAGCRVIGIDLDPRRVGISEQLGADFAFVSGQIDVLNEIRHLTDGHGLDTVLITAASSGNTIVQQAMEMTRKKGRVVVVGAVGLGLERSPFYEKEIDFLISCSYGPGRYDENYEKRGGDYPYAYVRWTENRNMTEYLRLVAEHRIELASILEREYALDQVPLAYEALRAETNRPLGILLRYPMNLDDVQNGKLTTKVVFHTKSINDKINMAVIGAGSFARNVHLPNLKSLSDLYHIRAVVSATGSNVTTVAQQFGTDYASTDYEEVINDPETDAVLIATRHHLHAQQTAAALQAGKHVYCEKPLALDEEQLDQILAYFGYTCSSFEGGDLPFISSDSQPVLMVGFNRRFSPAAQRIKAIARHRQNPLMVTYRVNAGYLPPDHWVYGPEGGGRVIGEACHMFDFFQFLTDSVVTEMCVQRLGPRTEHISSSDNVCVTLHYTDGSVCSLLFTSLGNDQLGKEYVEIFVDGKVLTLDDYEVLDLFGVKLRPISEKLGGNKGHLEALRAFGEAIKRRDQSPSGMISASLTSIRVNNLISD